MSKKEIKEYLVVKNGKTTNIQPVSIGDNRDFLKRSLNPVFCKNCASIRCFAFDPESKALRPCENGSLYQSRKK